MSPLLAAGVGVQPGIGVGNGPPSQPDIPPVLSSLAVGSVVVSDGSVVALLVSASVVVLVVVLDAVVDVLAVLLALAEPSLELSLPSVVPIVSTSTGPW